MVRGPKLLRLDELPLKLVGRDQQGRAIYVLTGGLDSDAMLSIEMLGLKGPREIKPVGSAVDVIGYLGGYG